MADTMSIDASFTPSYRLSSVKFLTFTAEEIKKMSCKQITNPDTFDSLLHPNPGGLHDPALGPCDKQELCGTCGLNYIHCPGHMGHIVLPLCVFHPIFFQSLYKIFRGMCFVCDRFVCTQYRSLVLQGQIALLDKGLVSEALELVRYVNETQPSEDSGEEQLGGSSIVERTRSYVQSCLERESAQEQESSHQPTGKTNSKHLTELRQLFIDEFFSSLSTTRCPHCEAPIRKIRHEYQTKVMIRPLSGKQSAAWKMAVKKCRMNQADQMETEVTNLNHLLDKSTEQHFFNPVEAMEHLRMLWANEPLLMSNLFSCLKNSNSLDPSQGGTEKHPTDMFFIDVVAVPPTRFRPISSLGSKRFENSQTTNLQRILKWCVELMALLKERSMSQDQLDKLPPQKKSISERFQYTWTMLQTDVNSYMDSDINKKAKDMPSGIKQIMEKKEGLFRKHMMGKRVNYAARSVISPDPNINMDQIGIPMVFARKLTYPQPVTHWNVHELRQAVVNGPMVHPGATHIQNEDGTMILLNPNNLIQRQGIAKRLLAPDRLRPSEGVGKKVHRHLKNGDILLLNRQPTLHKPSIMAMKARVLPGEKTLRLHYANCKAFNADFDGDEMNAHFPQNELARSEAYNLVSTHYQYLVPKDGTPLSGLIQDHVVSGLLMTVRGRMFTCSDYQQLLFAALPSFLGYFKLLPPCTIKPQCLWSGKQVISTLLVNLIPEGQKQLNLVSKTKINPKSWAGKDGGRTAAGRYRDDIMTESEVVFREGNLVCGILDKSQLGASQYGFIHACHELYGGAVTNALLSALGRVFTFFLQLHGFSLGIEDILVTKKADKERRKIIRSGRKKGCGLEAAAEAFGVSNFEDNELITEKYRSNHHAYSGNGLKVLDYYVKKKTDKINNSINTACVPNGLLKPFPFNALQLMVQAGAKGSTVNCMQISCLLGQIELEGQRPPIMLSGKSLPSFSLYDTKPRSGGFIDGRFLTGIRPQEFFFHCMAGREGLIDTAVKTSRSGYLQRCLIKHLEGITGQYDLTVRDSDGSVLQFLYGEDGLDVGKTRYLTPNQIHFLKDNYQAYLYKLDPKSSLAVLDSVKAEKYQRKVDKWMKKRSKLFKNVPSQRRTGFLDFYEHHLPEVKAELTTKDKPHPQYNYRTKSQLKVIDMWCKSSPMFRKRENSKYTKYYDPVMFALRADRHFGSIPERLIQQIDQHLDQYTESNSLSKDKLRALIQFKCLRALSDPGEGVGLLAAQSIGEPSTQMTLNTFHFAGRGEMNVTLGIPRLREILMTASPNIKTPAMEVPLLPLPNAEQEGERLKKSFTCVHLKDVLDSVEVWERVNREGEGFRHRLYSVKFTFLEHSYYKNDYLLKPEEIVQFIEHVFILKLIATILKEMKIIKDKRGDSVAVITEHNVPSFKETDETIEMEATPTYADDDDTDISDIDMDEPDAGNEKMKNKKRQQISYDASDEEKEEELKESDNDEVDVDVVGIDSDINNSLMEVASTNGTRRKGSSKKKAKSTTMTPFPAGNITGMDQERVKSVKDLSSHVVEYVYDPDKELWCQITLKFPCVNFKVMVAKIIEKLSGKVTIREVPNIRKGFLSMNQSDGAWQLKTEGVNMQELWKHEGVLDLKRSYTNNIHSMANTFGIEAANRAIIKEISSVFGVYGIQVDYRHLSLIADYMTFDGSYKPFNRYGMESNSSPFQKMSFETTMKFLKAATVNGDEDQLKSPSACLVAGRATFGGTGCVSLRQQLV